jgi:hypothetical protein
MVNNVKSLKLTDCEIADVVGPSETGKVIDTVLVLLTECTSKYLVAGLDDPITDKLAVVPLQLPLVHLAQ